MKHNFYNKTDKTMYNLMTNSFSNTMTNTDMNNISKGAGEIIDKAKDISKENLALLIIGSCVTAISTLGYYAYKIGTKDK